MANEKDIKYINREFGDFKTQLIEFYNKHQEELILMPASHKRAYHNAIPGGYVDHVNRVITGALKLHSVWQSMGVYTDTYTIEELVFSALNHDLGKMVMVSNMLTSHLRINGAKKI